MNLNTLVEELPHIGPSYSLRLNKLDIATLRDLYFHLPSRYEDLSKIAQITNIHPGVIISTRGVMNSIKNQYTKSGKKFQIGEIEDSTGKIMVIWFNQPFLTKVIYPGTEISIAGKVDFFGRKIAFISPEYEIIHEGKESIHTGKIVSIYPETYGVSSKWLRVRFGETWPIVRGIFSEYLPKEILSANKLIKYDDALDIIHFPKKLDNILEAKKRLAFEELLNLQVASVIRKNAWEKTQKAPELIVNLDLVADFIQKLPFKLTDSQNVAVGEILDDIGKKTPMNRLLEGDVGSGKTVVAAIAAFVSFLNGYQTVFMAPTQILAQQHYQTLETLLSQFKIRVALITSGNVKKDIGRTDIFVGTHSLIQKGIKFDQVGFVIIDEQHKFGVKQREFLIKKSGLKKLTPHFLTMTATPIPRTVALTIYGDLELSTLNELPTGRIPITTWVVPPQKRIGAYGWIKKMAGEGAQVFIVCPLIEESENESMKSVKAVKVEFENIKKIFPKLNVGILHGKQKMKEKNKVVEDFKNKKIDILVSTPVIEVGIDIPNATIMVIEAAERFGLASLHQLRGRVGRGGNKSYCLLFSEGTSSESIARLSAMETKSSGFELAELDLKLRGPGQLFGTRQHGFVDLKIASWSDYDLIKSSKNAALKLTQNPKKYKDVLAKLYLKQTISN